MNGVEPDPAGGWITIITVQYNNAEDTRALFASIADADGSSECDVVVVDNSTSATELAIHDLSSRARQLPSLEVLRPPQNLYYWGGAEFALENSVRARSQWPSWIIICNNDVTLSDSGFLTRLRSLDSVEYPIIAPAIISRDTGNDQNPLLELPPTKLQRLKWRVYDLHYGLARAMLSAHAAAQWLLARASGAGSGSTEDSVRARIYAPHGAFLILSSAFFERGGALDASVPMFGEELTIAATAERLGLPVYHLPELRVSHREHSTTGSRLTREKYEMERMARRHYFALTQ